MRSLDRGRAAAHDLAGDARHQPIGGAIAVGGLDGEVARVDAVPGTGDMKNEMRPPHLAVGENIEAKLFLLAQHHHGGVVERFLERIAGHAEGDFIARGLSQPCRPRKAADAGRGEWRQRHGDPAG